HTDAYSCFVLHFFIDGTAAPEAHERSAHRGVELARQTTLRRANEAEEAETFGTPCIDTTRPGEMLASFFRDGSPAPGTGRGPAGVRSDAARGHPPPARSARARAADSLTLIALARGSAW